MEIKNEKSCRWDAISLGEVMLRLDPGDMRVRTARNFAVWEGGGEYNVARGLKKCFGMRTAVVTALVENDIGYLINDLICQGGVDTRFIKWLPFDGTGTAARNGLNFTERGFGIRGARGVSDRGHTAVSKMKKGDIDWKKIFHEDGCRWFHCGGIFSALSDTTPDVTIEAMKAAKESGTIISYDLNYRPSLWKSRGGEKAAREINSEIVKYVDVIIGNEEDFTAALGFSVEGLDEKCTNLNTENFRKMIIEVVKTFPNIKCAATTLRKVKSAGINDWGAILYDNGNFFEAQNREDLEIYDRVGGGDSFASGLIYGYLTARKTGDIVEYGAAHGALAMTTPGDTSMVLLSEVEDLVNGGGSRVNR